MNENSCKTIEKIAFYILLGVTVIWFFFFINKGIDVSDQAYYLAKYKYFFESSVGIRSLGVFLSDLLGAVIYNTFNSGQVLVLSVCSWGLYMGSGLMVYRVLRQHTNGIWLLLSIFAGSLFSLTWVHVLNYNATSMFMQTVSICVLISGIRKDNKFLYILSGLLFGINTFFRLPNILQVCIGIAILWYFGVGQARWKEGLKKSLLYAAGVICGWGLGGITALAFLGKESILGYFGRTATMAGDAQSSHGIVNILYSLVSDAKTAVIDWLLYGTVVLLLLVVFYLITRKKEIGIKTTVFLGILLVAYGFFIGTKLEYYNFMPMIGLLILAAMFVGALYYRKRDSFAGAVCVIGFCAEAVVCIGTDNGWVYQLVFLILPLSLLAFAVFKCADAKLRRVLAVGYAFVLAICLTVGVNYATEYVYRDSPMEELNYPISSEEYKGIKTSKERAEYLDELDAVLSEFGQERLLAYGDCNIAYVTSEMKPYLNRVWIDLASYSESAFETELADAVKEKGYPVILLADMDNDDAYRSEKKLELIQQIIKQGKYTVHYENEWFSVYVPNLE